MNIKNPIESSRRKSKAGRLSRLALTGSVLIGLFALGSAQAEWNVIDRKARDSLKSIDQRIGDGNVNENLTKIYNQHQINKYKDSENTKKADAPEEVLDDNKPSTQVDVGIDKRCPLPSMTSGTVGQNQHMLCQELVKTELAKYKYSLKMYKVTEKRNSRLEEIEKERQGIKESEPGRLQDNSNKLLALLSRMEIDRQQQKTYMDAYEARLTYLTAARDTLTQQSMEGDKSITSAAIAVTAGAAMAAALNGLETERDDWRQYRR
jgi:hypothetical protein